jgi:hypothetical protein
VVIHSGPTERQRRDTAGVVNFAAVAPLLAQTGQLATLSETVMVKTLERFGLRALPPPFPVPRMRHRLIWGEMPRAVESRHGRLDVLPRSERLRQGESAGLTLRGRGASLPSPRSRPFAHGAEAAPRTVGQRPTIVNLLVRAA